MKKTENYELNKPEASDFYNIEHFNENADRIDEQLKENQIHRENKENPHNVTKKQIGLENVPNVDTNDQTPTYTAANTNTALTSGEKLSVAMGKIAKAVSSLISHLANTSNPHGVTKAQVGLENVDNTSDANKPISSATQTALDNKVDKVSGKGLSTNDYTTTEKNKLAGIAASANNYSHPNSGATEGTYRSVTVNAQGHVTAGSNPTTTVEQGGTGQTTIPNTLKSYFPNSITSGSIPLLGTGWNNNGYTSPQGLRNMMGLGNNTGALPVANGGTGKTTATDAANAFMNALSTGDSAPIDADYYISQYAGGGTTYTTYHRRPVSALWTYIKSKADSVYAKSAHTHNYAGSASAGGAATTAVGVQDYGNTATTIKIGYSGSGATVNNLSHIAGYLTGGTQIKDVSKEVLKSWLGLGTAAYTASTAYAASSHTHTEYAAKSIYGDETISMGRKSGSKVGSNSIAIGYNVIATGEYSYAEGDMTVASGVVAHAEGSCTTALDYQHAEGHYNDTTLATANTYSGTSTGTAFVIGNGTSSNKSNAFRVTSEGKAYAKAAFNSTGADYAEFAEWADGNPDNEDRRGYFVTFDEEKSNMIRKANEGEYILGIVSGNPCVIGNADEGWLGKYEFDEFGAIVYEDIEEEVEYIDEETGETKTKLEIITTYKINPGYDPERKYIHRSERPEWDCIGWIGVLSVRDDGTCIPGGYCKVADGGIATTAERDPESYRVLERVNGNIVKVALK